MSTSAIANTLKRRLYNACLYEAMGNIWIDFLCLGSSDRNVYRVMLESNFNTFLKCFYETYKNCKIAK